MLTKLICGSYIYKTCGSSAGHMSMRPCLCVGAVGALKDGRPRETLDRVVSKMQAVIRRSGEGPVEMLLAARDRARVYFETYSPEGAETIFESVGAIIYDMEWTSGDSGLEFENLSELAGAASLISPEFMVEFRCAAIVEVMLLIDYGFPAYPLFGSRPPGSYLSRLELRDLWSFEMFSSFLTATAWRWKQGQAIPDVEAWERIADVMLSGTPFDCCARIWDAATMFYYYHSRRTPVDAESRRQGWTGYMGVLQEMVAEVPTRGPDRLERKLSLDVHFLIPHFVKDQRRREQMTSIAQDLASRHGCRLARPDPPIWSKLLGWMFGSARSRRRPQDEENRGQEESWLKGWRRRKGKGRKGVKCRMKAQRTSAQRGSGLLEWTKEAKQTKN